MRRAFITAVALAFAVAACGDDDDVDAQPYIDAVSEELQEPAGAGGLELDEDAADCTATALVGAVETDDLRDIDADDFADADSLDDLDISLEGDAEDQLHDDLDDCDLEPVFVEAMVADIGVELRDEEVDCLAGALDDNDFARRVTSSFVDGSGQSVEVLFRTFAACPDVLAELFAIAIEEQMGAELSSDAVECIGDQIEIDPPAAAEAMAGGDAAEAFGAGLIEACSEIASG